MKDNKTIKRINCNEIDKFKGQLIDVREPFEVELGAIKGAKNIPLGNLENELAQIDKNEPIAVYCQVGKRGAKAAELLQNHGYNVVNLEGGYKSYHSSEPLVINSNRTIKDNRKFIEASGMQCPGPILKVKENIDDMQDGEQLEIHVTDTGFCSDIEAWATATGNRVISNEIENNKVKAVIEKGNINQPKLVETKDGATMVVFSGDLDKALASFIIATGAASYGKEVTMFFTFWGLNVIKKQDVKTNKKGLDKVFSYMMPKHAGKLPISKMNMGGIGSRMIRYVMNEKKVDSLEIMIAKAQSMGVKMVACTMSMDIMSVTKEELIDDVSYGGVATYLGDTERANLNLFI
ncbi:DsrE/DsrF/DrsH-like family protein [Macrococcus lamae]|uniref:Rhodanese domain-containing protein n=1 Tax=Macrococcus lamae TaxID=198484 RepID=A0A4R6BWC3_9STAP|nr:DsrE/DsrF/DrsH-like family protein [Macrococcus lamae]TDM12726.1 hypothetical protein ERX29_01605 [Macrococcus lamae]